MKQPIVTGLSAAGLVLASGLVWAAGQYGPGASKTEIKIGNAIAYSGAGSAYGVVGKSEAAYFAMINDQGGVNGRKITFITRDDGYSPPKTFEVVRRLVEQDQVLLVFSTLGTAPNSAIQGYLNDKKVPQLFVASGADKWDDPKHHPWTMGWLPSYRVEARVYGRYILKNLPNAKIAVLSQNDDSGKDYLIGLREGLGDKADKMIVATQTYETTDPTVDSQVVALQGSGADVLLTTAIPKFAAQAIRKIFDIGWKPTHFLTNVSVSVKAVMQPAGPEKAVGIISAAYLKEPTDPQWQDTPEYKEWLAWMKKYNTSASVDDINAVYGYSVAQTMAAVLKASGDNLTRENVMKQAASIKNEKLPMLLPGITISTSADDFAPIKQMQLQKFNGTTWQLFGDVISGADR
ncbi:MAG TPA: ABC transporter substrate-binding protein [Xanthobacteraceae bacterium]|nr:ABC transporter substrate-binding protein [Xanthobacteraceae bacterium]